MEDELWAIVTQMRALGFDWKASFKSGRGLRYYVRFSEHMNRPDKIEQSASNHLLVQATKDAEQRTLSFIARVGEGWHTRPIKRTDQIPNE